MAKRVNAAPPGFHTVTPYLSVDGAMDALEFYKKAFGAKEITRWRQVAADGKVVHSRFKIGDSLFMMSDGMGMSSGTGHVTLHVYSKDADKLWKDALGAGAKVVMPLADMYWGERYGQFEDPFQCRWSVSMVVPMSKAERAAKQKEAMAAFSQGEHPGRSD